MKQMFFWNSLIFSMIQWMLDHRNARESQKNIYFCFIDYAKVFDCVDHNKQWKQCQTLFFWAPKSLQMVTAAMKLKDAYSWRESYKS